MSIIGVPFVLVQSFQTEYSVLLTVKFGKHRIYVIIAVERLKRYIELKGFKLFSSKT